MSGMPDGMIITKKECMLLAAGAGVPALFGRFSDAGEESEEELLQQLFQMSKDGLIRVSDCKIEADAYLQEAFATVRESRKILTVYPGTGFGQPFYFYLSGNSAVWMRESMLDSEELYVSLIEAGQVWEAVEETCELPDVAFPPGLLRELDVREEMEICFRPVAELWTGFAGYPGAKNGNAHVTAGGRSVSSADSADRGVAGKSILQPSADAGVDGKDSVSGRGGKTIMTLVDVYVPSVDHEYDFGLDEKTKISGIIEEIASMVSQKEQCELKGRTDELLLCSMKDKTILPRDKTLEECGILNGSRLILV